MHVVGLMDSQAFLPEPEGDWAQACPIEKLQPRSLGEFNSVKTRPNRPRAAAGRGWIMDCRWKGAKPVIADWRNKRTPCPWTLIWFRFNCRSGPWLAHTGEHERKIVMRLWRLVESPLSVWPLYEVFCWESIILSRPLSSFALTGPRRPQQICGGLEAA